MPNHSHRFIEGYHGLVGFGMNRKTDEASLKVYLQKFSDDDLLDVLCPRLSDAEINEVVDLVHRLMRNHFTEDEYHRLFLKDGR